MLSPESKPITVPDSSSPIYSPSSDFDALFDMADAAVNETPKVGGEEKQSSNVAKESGEENRPPSGQQTQQAAEVDELEPSDSGTEDSEEDVDPADEIPTFDWDELHERYHQAMSTASTQEQELLNEFAQLMAVLQT